MAALNQRQTMLLIASAAFVVLQLTDLVAAATGRASFYTPPYEPNACFGFGGVPADKRFAAGGDSANANIWNNGGNCGKYFSIKCVGNGCRNGGGPIRVEIIDRCPNGCSGGRAFDLSAEAFAAIANPDVGVITVEYSSAFSSHHDEDAVPWAKEKLIAEVGHM